LTNAVKFTAAGGVTMRLSMRRRGGRPWLRAAVADTGPGIPRQERHRIFEEFSRLDRPGDRAVRGTGLGLAISRRIADALGGTLRVVSVSGAGRETGSLFWLSVPVGEPADVVLPPPAPARGIAAVLGGTAPVRAALERLLAAEGYRVAPHGNTLIAGLLLCHTSQPPTGEPPAFIRRVAFGPGSALDAPITGERLRAALSGARLSGGAAPAPPVPTPAQRLLVADDDPINREIAASLLRHLGHLVITANDGPAAFAAARADTFDCVLLDLHMPGMDGIDLARAIRRLPAPACFTRLVAVTADVDANARDLLLAAGIDALVVKPVTLERLADALPRAAQAAPAAARPAVDAESRRALAAMLAPGRFAALLASFWEELLRSLAPAERLCGSEGDRRLHSLAGSAASLGYLDVTAAARGSRTALATSVAAFELALPGLLHALAAALHADTALLPPELVDRAAGALAAPRSHDPPLAGARLAATATGGAP
jgi:CheY-like chemotaxis protein